jgi:hypothetical protein
MAILLSLPQTGLCNWVYSSDPNGNGTQGFFGFKANVIESGGNYSTSTAVLTSYSGPSTPQIIPTEVEIDITVNPGTAEERSEIVTCTVRGFENFTLASEANWTGDVNIIGNFNLNGNDLTVNSPVKQVGHLNLSGGSFIVTGTGGWNQQNELSIGTGGRLIVPGSYLHLSGSIYLGGGRLEIGGDYLEGADWDGDGICETYCSGLLYMTDAADYMKVRGDARFCSYLNYYGAPRMSAGTLEILGNLTQQKGANGYGHSSYQAIGTHRTLLSGTGTQTVSFDNPDVSYYFGSRFATLEVTNPNPLVFRSVVTATKVTSPAPLAIQSPGEGGICGTLECEITYSGTSFTMLSTMDLAGHAVTVNCPVKQVGSLVLSGGSFTVTGTGGWNQQNELFIGTGGRLVVLGNYLHQSGSIYLGGGRLEIGGDYLEGVDWDGDGTYETYCNGRIHMTDEAGYMKVGGNARFFSYLNYGYPQMSAGTLEILGNFRQESDANGHGRESYSATGTHRTLLSGTSTQTIYFANPDSYYASYFASLEVTNPNPLVFQSVVRATKVTSPAPLTIQSPGEGGICGTLECEITYSGTSFTMLSTMDLAGHAVTVNCPVKQVGSLVLSGGSFTVTGTGGWNQQNELFIGTGGRLVVLGNYLHQSGSIYLGGGRLEIGGDYLEGVDWDGDGTYETYCNGRLYMTDAAGYMKVGGNAQFYSYLGYGYPQMSAGTLEILGNFRQKRDANGYGNSCFPATGTHRTLLSGTGTQTVSFESPGNSYFNILEVTNQLADGSTVSVANGGTLNLAFAGTGVIGALYREGTTQPNGLYDSTNTGGLITGTGKIQIGPFASYFAWTAANAPGQTADQDHDHDGVSNGIEYFMGKTGNDFTANPGIAADGTVTWPKSPAFNGSYAVQTSENLKDWTDVSEDAVQVTKNADSVIWTWPDGLETFFVRLVVAPN